MLSLITSSGNFEVSGYATGSAYGVGIVSEGESVMLSLIPLMLLKSSPLSPYSLTTKICTSLSSTLSLSLSSDKGNASLIVALNVSA
jgi:hypothetical protein